MSWVAAGIGAGLGALQGRANEKRQKKLDEGRRAAIRYSWASGLKDPGAQSAGPGMLSSALQGGLQGAMIGQAAGLGGANAAATQQGSPLAMNMTQMQQPSPVMGGGTMPMGRWSTFA